MILDFRLVVLIFDCFSIFFIRQEAGYDLHRSQVMILWNSWNRNLPVLSGRLIWSFLSLCLSPLYFTPQLPRSATMVCLRCISCFCSSCRCCRTPPWSQWKVREAPTTSDIMFNTRFRFWFWVKVLQSWCKRLWRSVTWQSLKFIPSYQLFESAIINTVNKTRQYTKNEPLLKIYNIFTAEAELLIFVLSESTLKDALTKC